MGQQRETRERPRSRSPGKLGWKSALQTKFPMGNGNCKKLPRYDRRPRSPQTVSIHIQPPKKSHIEGRYDTSEESHRTHELRGETRRTAVKRERERERELGNINTHFPNAIGDIGKTINNTQTITTAGDPRATIWETRHRRTHELKQNNEKMRPGQ